MSRNVDETRRGRATLIITTMSYLGFLLGHASVGEQRRTAEHCQFLRGDRILEEESAVAALHIHPAPALPKAA